MNKVSVIIIFLTFFTITHSQCINDKYYKYYHNLIQGEKDNIQNVFDKLLERYGNIDTVLEDLLRKLNKTTDEAVSGLDKLENFNKNISNTNNESDTNLESLLKDLNAIEDELKSINISKSFPGDIKEAENGLNKTVHIPANVDVPALKKEQEKWTDFLKELNARNFSKDIMNIPHNAFEEITLLDKLITEGFNASCYDKFHDDLKLLFKELANLLELNIFQEKLNKIKENASRNKNDADDIVSDTNDFLENEKEYKDIHRLTNETLQLAEEIEKVKRDIEKLSGRNEEIMENMLKKLKEEHEAELRELDEKYNVIDGQLLLNDLETIKQEIENINMEDLEMDIDNYIRDIKYYTCILDKCETATTSDCKREK